ncbi:MAG: uroporphyrinogen-III C-methyltransferase, partial [Sedimentisphaerales bacterium]|nr:uroporphyrinogen-III C-methyltransferase [Sedimentisphaerales bacterium]
MSQAEGGIVYLAGAGPGDPGLITVRALELLSRADVIVYDYLANESLLRHSRPDAELIYVGKKAGQHSMPQESINELLVNLGQKGLEVLRLKGGDPFIFGRGGEEAQALAQAGVRFEVIPGVTAGSAVAAYSGIPVTQRNIASTVCFITGHEDPTKQDSQINWQALARLEGTLVFYMGVKNLPEISHELIAHGLSPSTPTAIIEKGTRCSQRTITARLDEIAQAAATAKVSPPAIIVVGHVVSLREQISWYEKRPLFGKTIAITRARTQASSMRELLTELGAEVVEFPTIRTLPPDDISPLETAIIEIYKYNWLIFTSINGVESFFDTMFSLGLDTRRVSGVKIAAIGPATAEKLRVNGIIADLIPEKFVAESIAEAFDRTGGIAGQNILLPRADIARPVLAELLEAMDAIVTEVTAYKTITDTG